MEERVGERRFVLISFPSSILFPLVPRRERKKSLMQPCGERTFYTFTF
jgi:hypothetical protein